MELDFNGLTTISPIDGRYWSKTKDLAEYFSEYALIRYRVLVEIEYFLALSEIPLPQMAPLPKEDIIAIHEKFSVADARQVKEIERTTNHDVKAVEYFLRKKFIELGLDKSLEFIHFGLTSQDINNTAFPMMIRDAVSEIIHPQLDAIILWLESAAQQWSMPMLARTHGQPASPTTVGKELLVFSTRLRKQFDAVKSFTHRGKFGGATGNMNAHFAAYPAIDWHAFASEFLEKRLGLTRNFPTTQIDHYDDLASFFDAFSRINIILKDLCQDLWLYISTEYFTQKTVKEEVGSSAMPHKVNPIDFENAEGNLGIAVAIFDHLSRKLPVSRLQRDLTDSTVLRNVGVPFAHSLIAYHSILKGFSKLQLNEAKLQADLEDNWAVIAEPIQTILRREGYPDPYGKLKEFSRGRGKLTAENFREFIGSLDVSEKLKKELLALSPMTYTGR